MVRPIILSLLWTLLIPPLFCQNTSVLLDAEMDFTVVQNADYFPDQAAAINIEEIKTSTFQNNFQAIDSDTKLDPAVSVYWLRFSLESRTTFDEKWILEFPNWAYVNLYTIDSQGNNVEKKAGFLLPVKDRDYPKANYNYIQFPAPHGTKWECFVRLESVVDKQYIPANLNFIVHAKDTLDQENETRKQIISIVVGVFLAMFFYNLFVFFSTKDSNYSYYLMILVMLLNLTLNNSGYIVEVFSFWDDFPAWRDSIDNFAVTILIISSLLFARRLLNFKTYFPKWYNIFTGMIIAAVIVLVIQFINYDIGLILSSILSLLMFLFIIIVAIKAIKKKVPSSVYFFIGWIFPLVGSTLLILAVSGVLPSNDFNMIYALPLGSTLEMILFSFALGNKINILKRENESKQEKIINQLRENEELQTKVQRELEEKVKERTQEINTQKEEIENQRDAIELEKEKADSLLLNILPETTAKELKQNGYAVPRHYEKVSVLFNDIVGFTKIAEKMSPEELVKNLDYCFRVFDEIVARNNLEKIKTIGDSYMCASGLPTENDTNPIDAVRAGLEMLSFMDEWNAKKIAEGKDPWELKVGIHTGPLVSGVVGKDKFAYDIWGDTVNIASRMVSSEGVGKVNISGKTYSLVKDKFNCVYRGKVYAKNKGEIDMYYVEGEQA